MACPDVVVVGASAGGLEAVSEVIRSLPADFPAPVFIVIHRGAEGPAVLPLLLAKETSLPILIPTTSEPIRPGHIYVPPLDCHLIIENSHVRATHGPRQHGFRPAVDPLFISAAQSHGDRTAGVVLSGGLADGTAGLLAIKRRGGIAIVQNPEEALVPSMPLSALKNVEVDAVLPASEIGRRLVDIVRNRPERKNTAEGKRPNTEREMAKVKRTTPEPEGQRQLTPFTCPSCGGALWEVAEGSLAQYECHVGHRFSVEALKALGADRTENLLWAAVRALKEDAALRRRMAARATDRGMIQMAERWLQDARLSGERAQKIRELIEAMNDGAGEVEDVPIEARPRGAVAPPRRRTVQAAAERRPKDAASRLKAGKRR